MNQVACRYINKKIYTLCCNHYTHLYKYISQTDLLADLLNIKLFMVSYFETQ